MVHHYDKNTHGIIIAKRYSQTLPRSLQNHNINRDTIAEYILPLMHYSSLCVVY